MELKRKSGFLLIVVGLLHVSIGVITGWPELKTIYSYGVWNALGQQSQDACINNLVCMQMNAVWWSLALGLMVILFGALCAWVEKTFQRSIPAFFAGFLLMISGLGAILIPASGVWLLVAVAIYMLIKSQQEK